MLLSILQHTGQHPPTLKNYLAQCVDSVQGGDLILKKSSHVHKKPQLRMVTEALFVVVENWKQSKRPSVMEEGGTETDAGTVELRSVRERRHATQAWRGSVTTNPAFHVIKHQNS